MSTNKSTDLQKKATDGLEITIVNGLVLICHFSTLISNKLTTKLK